MQNLRRQLELLPDLLGWHVLLTVLALGIGAAIALPLGVWGSRRRGVAGVSLTVASVIQTVPSIALLALVFAMLLGIKAMLPESLASRFAALGFWPTLIGLTLYSLLPMLRNTVVGLREVDASLTEAARGLGMTPGQSLRRVELPLAMPTMLAGVRTATVWTVGIATLSTPIGQKSLGNYIFGGLQTFNVTAILVGCLAAAGLALVLDATLAGLEWSARHRSRRGLWAAGGVLAGVVGLALAGMTLGSGLGSQRATIAAGEIDGGGRSVRIGAKNFNEQFILAQVLAERLRGANFAPDKSESLGSMNAFDALAGGEIDVYIDYSGTLWANAMGRDDAPGRQAVLFAMTHWLTRTHGIRNLGPLGFESAYALAMRREQAERLGIDTLDDLARHAPRLRIGSDIEFFERPEWARVRSAYGLEFADRRPMNPTLMYEAVAGGEVDVITAFTSDGRIAAYDLKILSDPRGAFPPYDAVLLLSAEAAADEAVVATLLPLVGKIDVEAMRRANLLVDVEGKTVEQAAEALEAEIEP